MTKNSHAIIARRALCLCLLFSIFQFSVFAENTAQPQETAAVSSDSVKSDTTSEWKWNTSSYEQAPSQVSTFALFFKMVFALAVVLALAYFAVRVLKKGAKLGSSDDPFLRHVSHVSIGTNRSVDVVTILDHAYLLGVSDNSVNLIAQIENQELVNSMNLYADKKDSSARPRSFEDILSIFMPNVSKFSQGQSVYGNAANDAAESLRQQRNRLNEEV